VSFAPKNQTHVIFQPLLSKNVQNSQFSLLVEHHHISVWIIIGPWSYRSITLHTVKSYNVFSLILGEKNRFPYGFLETSNVVPPYLWRSEVLLPTPAPSFPTYEDLYGQLAVSRKQHITIIIISNYWVFLKRAPAYSRAQHRTTGLCSKITDGGPYSLLFSCQKT